MENQIENIIIDKLISEINDDKYEIHEKLPSENVMADFYKIPRITARKAYKRLEEMGYIYSIQGKGRYLKGKQQYIELHLTGDKSFSQKMLETGRELVTKNIIFGKIQYDKKIYDELGINKDDEVYKVGRVRIIDKKPSAIHMSYLAKSVFKNIAEDGKSIESIFSYYELNGYLEFTSSKSIISISYPTADERDILGCPSLVPLLILETNCIDIKKKKVLEYTKIIYRGDTFKYVLSTKR
ncbi:GntR family transcriptional regulator [Clostridium lacusfryxellense]|uniref:GntR family transcriptional regulator n=1 Tax=Clostridium lacusfryxellense TaxID=205328 RepID=UPI001C0DCB3A|nr:GntR family transcriptional regulator [Clostridium lacusfryxellense]MBU3112536.1 GntR family transcriptional regulator [Clostridium lacusfryxellense]